MDFDLIKYHPRILELRVTLIHSVFVLEFGTEKAMLLFREFCDIAMINYTIISSIIGRKHQILGMNRTDRLRYRQEVIAMGLAWGETREGTGAKYLNISRSYLYTGYSGMLRPEKFYTEEWIGLLDYSTVVAGVEAYRIECRRMIDFLEGLGRVVG